MSTHRFFRTATHPEFIAYEIEPALVAAELPTALGPTIGQLVDLNGSGVHEVVASLKAIILAYGEESRA
jgi:hypothetical protein